MVCLTSVSNRRSGTLHSRLQTSHNFPHHFDTLKVEYQTIAYDAVHWTNIAVRDQELIFFFEKCKW